MKGESSSADASVLLFVLIGLGAVAYPFLLDFYNHLLALEAYLSDIYASAMAYIDSILSAAQTSIQWLILHIIKFAPWEVALGLASLVAYRALKKYGQKLRWETLQKERRKLASKLDQMSPEDRKWWEEAARSYDFDYETSLSQKRNEDWKRRWEKEQEDGKRRKKESEERIAQNERDKVRRQLDKEEAERLDEQEKRRLEDAQAERIRLFETREYHLDSALTHLQREKLYARGFKKLKISPFGDAGASYYWVETHNNHRKEHDFFCYFIRDYVKEFHKTDAEVNHNSGADVVFEHLGRSYAIDVETGTNEERNPQYLEKRFEDYSRRYDTVLIFVTRKKLKRKYEPYGNVITRATLRKVLAAIFG